MLEYLSVLERTSPRKTVANSKNQYKEKSSRTKREKKKNLFFVDISRAKNNYEKKSINWEKYEIQFFFGVAFFSDGKNRQQRADWLQQGDIVSLARRISALVAFTAGGETTWFKSRSDPILSRALPISRFLDIPHSLTLPSWRESSSFGLSISCSLSLSLDSSKAPTRLSWPKGMLSRSANPRASV